jgi:nucleoside-diphosphate-sugar epimerase
MVFPFEGSNKKVLMIGGRGFTGLYLRPELEQVGYQVISAVDADNGIDPKTEKKLDITSLDNCRQVLQEVQPDYIIHLASISFIPHQDPEAFYRVNVIGTCNLLQAITESGLTPQKIIIASSANVYGNRADKMINEDHLPAPCNHYAMSKLAMEHMVKNWFDEIPIVITRPFNYTGVGQADCFLVPKIVAHFSRRETEIELGNIHVTRDFSDVRAVVKIYRQLLKSPCQSDIINICSGRAYSLHAILEMMAEMVGYEIKIKINHALIRAKEATIFVGDPQKLIANIGPLEVLPFKDTLQWMHTDSTHRGIGPTRLRGSINANLTI